MEYSYLHIMKLKNNSKFNVMNNIFLVKKNIFNNGYYNEILLFINLIKKIIYNFFYRLNIVNKLYI